MKQRIAGGYINQISMSAGSNRIATSSSKLPYRIFLFVLLPPSHLRQEWPLGRDTLMEGNVHRPRQCSQETSNQSNYLVCRQPSSSNAGSMYPSRHDPAYSKCSWDLLTSVSFIRPIHPSISTLATLLFLYRCLVLNGHFSGTNALSNFLP